MQTPPHPHQAIRSRTGSVIFCCCRLHLRSIPVPRKTEFPRFSIRSSDGPRVSASFPPPALEKKILTSAVFPLPLRQLFETVSQLFIVFFFFFPTQQKKPVQQRSGLTRTSPTAKEISSLSRRNMDPESCPPFCLSNQTPVPGSLYCK